MKAVIFGMNGVLYDSTPHIWQARKEYFTKIGIELKDEFISSLLGLSLKDQLTIIEKKHNLSIDYKNFEMLLRARELELLKYKLEPSKGVIELLNWLSERNIPKAIGSMNSRKNVLQNLRLLSLDKYFEVIVSVEDVEKKKPNPEFLLKAAEKLGVEPEECVYVDDSPNGIETAHKIGMKILCVISPQHTRKDYDSADYVVGSLEEVEKVLSQELEQK